jgi:hypothetical protein
MGAYVPLLKGDPYILAPDIDLTKNVATVKIVKEKGRCEKCGKILKSPYFLFIGILPCSMVIEATKCSNLDDEKDSVEYVIRAIRSEGNRFNIDSQYKWVFSDQNIMNSKTRICVACYEEYKGRFNPPYTVCIRLVYFAVEEYQRRHTPISFAKSDYERYWISLPDRSMMHWVGFGIDYGGWVQEDINWGVHMDWIAEFLRIALIPDHDPLYGMTYEFASSILQELRADFIQDKNRVVPNDQELTRWMRKHFSDHYEYCPYIKAIDSCEVFTNPKTTHVGNSVFNTKYSVIVHYIDTDWDDFDI